MSVCLRLPAIACISCTIDIPRLINSLDVEGFKVMRHFEIRTSAYKAMSGESSSDPVIKAL